ncbi:hypothetical protein F5883DRAFT_527750 [Diaporthe sp. PMI_573]|nr:hypothetical protein F5883DRAFT_527750 [Diaporthaceae sp. PMI_573]
MSDFPIPPWSDSCSSPPVPSSSPFTPYRSRSGPEDVTEEDWATFSWIDQLPDYDPSRTKIRRSVFEQLITKSKPAAQQVMDTMIGGYRKEDLHTLILNWITTHNLPFQIVESDEFKAILLYGNSLSLADALDDTRDVDTDGDDDATNTALRRVLDDDQEGAFGIDDSDHDGSDAGIMLGSPLEPPKFTYPISEVIDTDALAKFRKMGPIGKLHNVGVAIKRSPRLRRTYLHAQVGQPA